MRPTSPTVVAELLNAQKFSLLGNRKTLEGVQSPNRDARNRLAEAIIQCQI